MRLTAITRAGLAQLDLDALMSRSLENALATEGIGKDQSSADAAATDLEHHDLEHHTTAPLSADER
jgi:hypothetical protein